MQPVGLYASLNTKNDASKTPPAQNREFPLIRLRRAAGELKGRLLTAVRYFVLLTAPKSEVLLHILAQLSLHFKIVFVYVNLIC